MDLPYGLGVEEWDKEEDVWDFDQVVEVVQAVKSNNGLKQWVWFSWCHWKHMGTVAAALVSEGVKDVSPYYWHKPDMNVMSGMPASVVFSVECALLGFYPDCTEQYADMPKTPSGRHNHQEVPALRKYVLDDDRKTRINEHEKPVEALSRILKWYAKPSDDILVLCAGAGGEVRAAIARGHNVVAVEQDARQCASLHKQLEGWDAKYEVAENAAQSKATREANKKEINEEEYSCSVCGAGVVGDLNIRECSACGDYVCLNKCWPEQSETSCHKCMMEAMKEASEDAASTQKNDEEAPGSTEKPAADAEAAPGSPSKRLRSGAEIHSTD